MSTQMVFNPQTFKDTTRAQWDQAAQAWDSWGPFLGDWLGPVTERMLDLAGVTKGSRVLDVAAGAGQQTLLAATRVGPDGHVLATDISPAILGYAQSACQNAGLTNVSTREIDGEMLTDLPAGDFDSVISRVGLIYFPDQQKALAGMKHALKPGGRIGVAVYSSAAANEFFSIPVGIIRRRAGLAPPLLGQPGPFSLGADGVLAETLTRAGFTDVRVEKITAPLNLPSAAECVRFERESFGALHQMMTALSVTERNDTWLEIEKALSQFESRDGFVGPCEMLVGGGTNIAPAKH
ncbi:class I SAM-dependent methyltransferase [Marinobacter orientalis]|uniref:Methyltransferase domain-containing protein n=1 Tax=Marinobacter orientalis TaxID=1928859 RepID=A0A7Y0RC29_9GAMM|nr:methyltransferase domain-containing protein [Marinobacter orientalis]NMT63486.1 methyltransferase domain-containing protein [Marinobacter orientalis]TGX48547.1 methyltransferase domain-containing protein [Marinobacter orientalis]